jgi:hypothetical protein
MGKHRALYWTKDQALRDLEVKRAFDERAEEMNLGTRPNPQPVGYREKARHSAAETDSELWYYVLGDWYPAPYPKRATRPYNPVSGYTPQEWDDKYAPQTWYGMDGSTIYYPNGSS